MPYKGFPTRESCPKSGWKRPLPIRLMMASELVATGAWEMFWFQGLSAGNRFVPSNEADVFVAGIARIQVKRNVAANGRLRRQSRRESSLRVHGGFKKGARTPSSACP